MDPPGAVPGGVPQVASDPHVAVVGLGHAAIIPAKIGQAGALAISQRLPAAAHRSHPIWGRAAEPHRPSRSSSSTRRSAA
jgi:hypothetical protein